MVLKLCWSGSRTLQVGTAADMVVIALDTNPVMAEKSSAAQYKRQ